MIDFIDKKKLVGKDGNMLSMQSEVHEFFHDSTVADINDSLASILAICDSKDPNSVTKVKNHITKINAALERMREADFFNVNTSLLSLIHVLKSHYKKINFITSIPEVHYLAYGQRSAFEQMLFFLLNSILNSSDENLEIVIEAKPKNREFIIYILKRKAFIDKNRLEEIQQFKKKIQFEGILDINLSDENIFMTIQMAAKLKTIKLN